MIICEEEQGNIIRNLNMENVRDNFIFYKIVCVNMELSMQMGMVMLFLVSVVRVTRIGGRGPAEITIQ